MVSVRTALIGLALALIAYYQFAAPSPPLLPIQQGDAIVVTGSHTGIGKHAALTLSMEGYTVFACVRKSDHGDKLLESAKRLNIDASKLKPIILDVTNTKQVEAAVETVSAFVGDRGLHGLFNNAGVFQSVGTDGTSVEHIPMDMVRRIFDVNYFGLLHVTRAFLPLIRRGGGRIMNNGSTAGLFSGAFLGAYASSKFAVEALSYSLRRELDPHGVHVSILEAGFILSPLMDNLKNILTFAGKGVYAQAELIAHRKFAKMSSTGDSPRVTSEAVVHAMRSANPKNRYLIGSLSGATKLFSSLPASWADALIRSDRYNEAGMITDEELTRLLENTGDEFEL